MTKLCSVCSTENRDDAQFCRACGTPFPGREAAPAEPTEAERLAAGITCDECSFQNAAGVRYCAACGVNLLGTVIVPRARAAGGTASPPPISFPSFATVAPYPPAHVPKITSDDPLAGFAPDHPPSADDATAYDSPFDRASYDAQLDDPLASAYAPADADAPYATQEPEYAAAPAAATHTFASAPRPNRTPLLLGAAVLALAAAGAGAWWFMGSAGRTAASISAAASAASAAQPAAVALPASQAELAPATPMAAPAVATTASDATVLALPPLVGPGETVLVPAGSASPKVAGTASPFEALRSDGAASETEAKRLAAEKRREKAAKDKAEREAKVKSATDQQASAARADQDAQARRRAEEAQRPRTTVTQQPVPQAPVPMQTRGVREICAGRGTIGEAVCQSRECGAPEHANEAICREVREKEDRRRNYNN